MGHNGSFKVVYMLKLAYFVRNFNKIFRHNSLILTNSYSTILSYQLKNIVFQITFKILALSKLSVFPIQLFKIAARAAHNSYVCLDQAMQTRKTFSIA